MNTETTLVQETQTTTLLETDRTLHTTAKNYKHSFGRKIDNVSLNRVADLVSGHLYDPKNSTKFDPSKEERTRFLLSTSNSVPMAITAVQQIFSTAHEIEMVIDSITKHEHTAIMRDLVAPKDSLLHGNDSINSFVDCIKAYHKIPSAMLPHDSGNLMLDELENNLYDAINEVVENFVTEYANEDMSFMDITHLNQHVELQRAISLQRTKNFLDSSSKEVVQLNILEAALLGTAVAKLLNGVSLTETETVVLQTHPRLQDVLIINRTN